MYIVLHYKTGEIPLFKAFGTTVSIPEMVKGRVRAENQ